MHIFKQNKLNFGVSSTTTKKYCCISFAFSGFYNLSGIHFLNYIVNLKVIEIFNVFPGITGFILDGITLQKSSFGREVLDTKGIELSIVSISNVLFKDCTLDSRAEHAFIIRN